MTDSGVTCLQIPFSRSMFMLNKHMIAYHQLSNIMKDNHHSFIHTHTPIASALGRIACKNTQTKVIYTVHGFHFYNQMLYYNGEHIKGAALECVEYVMANTAPSHFTGNTHFGRFLNEDRINKFCDDCIKYLEKKLGVPAHGILSFDLKEDKNGNMKVTEVNIRHMAYTGIMAHVGFDLIEDTIRIHEEGDSRNVERDPYHHYEKPYIFLRDVDVEPIVLESEEIFEEANR